MKLKSNKKSNHSRMCIFTLGQCWLSGIVLGCVCVSVCLSVTSFPSYRNEIFRSNYHWQKRCPCKRSGVKVTEVRTNFAPIWTLLVRNSLLNSQMTTKWCTKLDVAWERCSIVFRDHLSNFKITDTDWKIDELALVWAFSNDNSSLNSLVVTIWHIASRIMEEVPYCF